jgi:hypothetical protein
MKKIIMLKTAHKSNTSTKKKELSLGAAVSKIFSQAPAWKRLFNMEM